MRECGEEQETRPFAVQLKVEYRWEVEKKLCRAWKVETQLFVRGKVCRELWQGQFEQEKTSDTNRRIETLHTQQQVRYSNTLERKNNREKRSRKEEEEEGSCCCCYFPIFILFCLNRFWTEAQCWTFQKPWTWGCSLSSMFEAAQAIAIPYVYGSELFRTKPPVVLW